MGLVPWRRFMGRLLMAVLTVLLGGLLAATLVRFAPGFGIDVHQLDTRLDQESVEARGQARAGERNILAFYWGYLTRAARGDLGMSHALGRPVAELVRERLPVTLRWVGLGWVAGWVLALLLAFSAALLRHPAFDVIATALSGVFLSLPSALLALVFLFFGETRYPLERRHARLPFADRAHHAVVRLRGLSAGACQCRS